MLLFTFTLWERAARRPKEDEQQKLRSNHTLQKKDPKMG